MVVFLLLPVVWHRATGAQQHKGKGEAESGRKRNKQRGFERIGGGWFSATRAPDQGHRCDMGAA